MKKGVTFVAILAWLASTMLFVLKVASVGQVTWLHVFAPLLGVYGGLLLVLLIGLLLIGIGSLGQRGADFPEKRR